MKALVLKETMHFSYEDVPEPDVGPNDVLIRLKVCAVCGSDVKGMDGSTGRRVPPLIMGHEAAGTIERVGYAVTGYAPGERVTFDSTIYCNECDMCESGRINLCRNRRVLGVSCSDYHQDGCFAEFVSVPSHILYRIPDSVSFRQAAMVEPLAIAYHAVKRKAIQEGDRVLIIGVGTIGMLCLQLARAMGASDVIAVDINDDRLRISKENGATHTINTVVESITERLEELYGADDGVDISIDATGIDATVEAAIAAVKLGGDVILIGNVAPKTSFALQKVVTGELTIHGSCASAGEYDVCLDWIAREKLDVETLISRVAPLSEGAGWMERLYRHEPGLYKVAFEM